MNLHSKGISLINQWRADWCKFVRDAFGVKLDKEQEDILHSIQTQPRTSVASGTARGKDFVAACASLAFLYLTPRWNKNGELVENTKVALTAPTDRQVKNIMLPEIARLFYRAKQRGVILPGKLNAYDVRTNFKEWFLTGFKADENNQEAWSGFHAVNTMFVVTEASGISDNTFDALEGNLQGNSRILLVFNPNTPIGYAARSQKSDRWQRFRLNSLTAPNVVEKKTIISGQVDYDWVADKLKEWCVPIQPNEATEEQDDFEFEGKWYRPDDLFRVKVLGKFPKVSEETLIPLQWIELANKRWQERTHGGYQMVFTGQNLLGVDVAGMGRDVTVFCHRIEEYVYPFETYNSHGSADHMQVAGIIHNKREAYQDMHVMIDTIGEGAGVFSRCLETDKSAYIHSCKFSESAKVGDRDLHDKTGVRKFANMRAYLFWAVRDWLDPKNNTGAMLPPDPAFTEEATEIRWFFHSDGKIIIEPKEDIKKRIGRSTDHFDALANTFYPFPKPANKNYLEHIERLAYN